ncbi:MULTISPECIES: XRE family transcriptional regulator [unclassified Caballeronia]|uniref:helix-turn-helix domain-containing protein n=1 Tax=unclassified Caballeronia TaxID=2646786 RepID=UPI002859831D|nr:MULTISPECIES: XRE family transcriptional regulator [unclassified Caballeronia]MDR5815989.1 XRE family transcriptional regulator [Caballeronia sp. LZ033]MDR5821809.1 XRE family transcriptional regulator [Caballeronia sp. LZ043]
MLPVYSFRIAVEIPVKINSKDALGRHDRAPRLSVRQRLLTAKSRGRAAVRPAERASGSEVQHPGELTRALRQRRGLTLDELASRTGISKGHLSRFERGEKSVSVSALMRVAQALSTSAATLLGEKTDQGVVHVVRTGDRNFSREGGAGYDFAPLSRAHGSDDGDGPTALLVRFSSDADLKEAAFHSGDEIFFVLSGAIEIELADQSVILRQGDFAQFPGLVRHRIHSLGSDAEVLIVVTSARDEQGRKP